MNEHVYLPLVTLDIHETTLAQLVFRLRLEIPWSYYFAEVSPEDPQLFKRRLGRHIGLSPAGRIELYVFLAECYNQTPAAWSVAWAQRRDGTIGEMHQRLWHEANMYGHPDDRCDYPLSPLCKQPVPQPDT